MMATKVIFTGERREGIGKWSRTVRVGEQEYACSVRQTKRVRIAFKPRGENWGWQYEGAVYRIGSNHGLVWCDRVGGTIGCRGLLIAAGILVKEDRR